MDLQELTSCQNRIVDFDSNSGKLWRVYTLPKAYKKNVDQWTGSFIVFVIKGNVKIVVNSLETYIIESKEMFLIREDFSYIIETLRQAQVMVCLFQTESLLSKQALISELIPLCNCKQDVLIKLPIKNTIMSYLTLLQTYIKDGVDSYSFFDLKRQEIFTLLFFYYSKIELAQFLYFIVGENIQFKEFVIKNYHNAKNVRELAVLANYSTSGFIKKFQKCFNESPYEWMQKQKAKQIFIEIKQRVKPLQEIAVEYKFSSYQHFSHFCKKQLGFSPTKIIN
jgi:AraC-like DNA-binding protein